MNFVAAAGRCWIMALLACLCATGCLPQGSDGLDEQKDPHFLTGQDRVSKMDYKGAVQSYEKALETNPKSASAHFELALLYEQKEPNPGRAIYHFERYLELRPSSDRADIVKQRIAGCKQELAKSITIAPGSPQLQRELERLKGEVERLMVENAQWRQYYAQQQAAAQSRNPAAPAQNNVVQQPTTPARSAQIPPANPAPSQAAAASSSKGTPRITPLPNLAPATTTRSHTIKPGETPSVIARMYGIKVEKLMRANPSLDPRKLRPGQTLVIPPP